LAGDTSPGARAQTIVTALTFAVPKGTDRGIEDEVAPAGANFPRPPICRFPVNRAQEGRQRCRRHWPPTAAAAPTSQLICTRSVWPVLSHVGARTLADRAQVAPPGCGGS